MIHKDFICELYFIRHGESESNATPGLASGTNYDAPLTDLGHQQAKLLGQRFRVEGIEFDRIYSSTMIRAIQTTENILSDMGDPNRKFETVSELIEQQIRHVDFLPTILDDLGISLDENFKKIDGVSLKPIIEGGSMVEKIAFSETGNPLDSNTPPKKPNTKSVRTSKWKLIYNEYNDSKELYDLEKDPDENENLIGTGLEIEKVLWTELIRIQNGD